MFQDSFEKALPSGSAWKYVGPKSHNNLTSLEVADNDGTVYDIPPIWALEMGARNPALLSKILRAFMDHAVFNEGGHWLQTRSNVLSRIVKRYSSDPWTSSIAITVAPRGVVSGSAMRDIVGFMKTYPFCEWDGTLCFCESPDVNFPTSGTSEVHVTELLRLRDLGLVPSLSKNDLPCCLRVSDTAGEKTGHCHSVSDTDRTFLHSVKTQKVPAPASVVGSPEKKQKLLARASVAESSGTLHVVPGQCRNSLDLSSAQKVLVPQKASRLAPQEPADLPRPRLESESGGVSERVADHRRSIKVGALPVSSVVQKFVVPRLYTLLTDMEKSLAVQVEPHAWQDPEQFYNALSKGYSLKDLVSSVLEATWLQDIHKLSSDSIVEHLRQVCQLVKKTHGLPQLCFDPVAVVLNEVVAVAERLSLCDSNICTEFACFLASGTKSVQPVATADPYGKAGELTNHVRIARTQDVLKAERERFRRGLYIQQLDGLGSLIPSSRATSPLGRQITCRHKFAKLTWGANPWAHYACCSACKLQRVIFYDVRAGQAAVRIPAERAPSAEQIPAEGELPAKAAATEKDPKTLGCRKRRLGRLSKSDAAVTGKLAKTLGSQKGRPGRPSKSEAAVTKKDAKSLGSQKKLRARSPPSGIRFHIQVSQCS